MANTLYRFIEGKNESFLDNEDEMFDDLDAIGEEYSQEVEREMFADLKAIDGEYSSEATALDRISDTGIDLAAGLMDLGESFVGLTRMSSSFPLDIADNFVDVPEEVRAVQRVGFDAIGYYADITGKFLRDLYSDERKEEEAEVEDATGVVGTIKALIKNPAVLAGKAVQTAPAMLSIIGVARVVFARASGSAVKYASLSGITDPKMLAKIGRKAGEKAAAIAAAAAEGIQQTGSSFNHLVDNAESIGKAYTSSVLSGFGTAGLAFLGGKLGRKLGLGDVEAGIKGKGGKIRRIVGGGIQEGLLEEAGQSGQEQA